MNFDTLVEEKVGEYFMDKGEKQGEKRGIRHSVKLVLNQRFGTIPKSLCIRLRQIEKPDTLNMLIAEAVKCDNLAAFRSIVDATMH